jgi:glycosyltransferase involved in cell wall biosynthesis
MSQSLTGVSVIVPLFNEEDNLALLHERVTESLTTLSYDYKVIYVDDGSTDNSLKILESLYDADNEHVCVIELRRNFGKTAALVAGFQLAHGDVIITMDADLQDDPAEIPGMITKLETGYDLVTAWRADRQDPFTKKLLSNTFNFVVSRATGTSFHDLNSGFKVFRPQVIKSIRLHSDLHRYIPVLAKWQGFNVTEKEVAHHPRHRGQSKYGIGRIARGFMDLLVVLFMIRYLRHPLRLFGWSGVAIFVVGGLINLYLAYLWLLRALELVDIAPIGTRPLLSVGILGMLLGIQLISIGLLGEMLRYFTYRPSDEFSVRRILQ